MTEPRECGNCGNEDCELCHEPREEKCKNCGKTKKEHPIRDKTGEYCCRPEDDSEFYEAALPKEEDEDWDNIVEEIELEPKKEGEFVTTKIYVDRTENKIDKVVINGKEFVSKDGEKEGEGCICGHFRWASCPVHGVKQTDPRDSLNDWEKVFDNLYANEWKPGHKHNERCEFTCCLRGDIKNFIQANFLSRTAVEKIIDGMTIKFPMKTEPWHVHYNQALRDLLEKINKG